jgi:hypothetical protein
MHEPRGEPHGADPAGRGDPGHRGMPDPPGPEFARLMAEKGESLRRYVWNEARSALAAEVRDGKVRAIPRRLRPAMADIIFRGSFSELPLEVRAAINSHLASGPRGWPSRGPLKDLTSALLGEPAPGTFEVFWEHLDREPHLRNDWETWRALRDLAERESFFEAHRPAAHDLEALLAAAKTTAGTKPRETSIGIWILFLIALLPIAVAAYYGLTTPPERPGEHAGRIIAEGVYRDRCKRLEDERSQPGRYLGTGRLEDLNAAERDQVVKLREECDRIIDRFLKAGGPAEAEWSNLEFKKGEIGQILWRHRRDELKRLFPSDFP